MAELSGRVALVTGASGEGMGRSIALTLARDGADVVVTYRRRKESAQRVVTAIEEMGRRAIAVMAEVSKAEEVQAAIDTARNMLGRLDILVNSAGGPWQPRDFTEITPEHWRRVMAAEMDAAFYAIRYALPIMREQRWGRIINIGGYLADNWMLMPADAPLDYPLGKAARHWLTRTLARHELRYGITINAVAPGTTRYIAWEKALAYLHSEDNWPERSQPTPQDIAEVVAFLASDRARFVTGSVIDVHGADE